MQTLQKYYYKRFFRGSVGVALTKRLEILKIAGSRAELLGFDF
jgi:hypothetical protein